MQVVSSFNRLLRAAGIAIACGTTEAKRTFSAKRTNEKSSPYAFPQVLFLIQLIDLHPHEIAPRDNTPDPTALENREMTKAVIAHLPQRVYCAVIGRNRDWIGRHRVRQRGRGSILAFGKGTHRITAGEDAPQALLFIDNQH
jgi:hypothetical protein